MPGAERRSFSPIAVELVDDILTTAGSPSAAPLGPITAVLDVDDGSGFRQTAKRAFVTTQAVVTFAGVNRVPRPATAPPVLFRVRIESLLYVPLYRATADGIQFAAQPWNDFEPALPTPTFSRAILLPSPSYPFSSYLRVVRGEVRDNATGLPVPDALVIAGAGERTLTDARGEFALALRWTPDGSVTLTATDRSAHTGTVSITVPADLEHGQLIAIS